MFEKLMEYQAVDGKLKAIEDELRASEEFRKYAKAVKFLKSVPASKEQIEDRAKALLSAMNELNARFAKLEEEKSDFDDSCDFEDEGALGFLKQKSADLASRLAAVEAEINTLKKGMDELLKEYKELSATAKKMKQDCDENKEKYDELKKEKEKGKEEILAELKKLESEVPAEYLDKYKAKRKDKQFPIVYEVKLGKEAPRCSACGTELSNLQVFQLREEKLTECENCRKLIFIKD